MAKKTGSKKSTSTKYIVNRRARHDYSLDDSLVLGMALTGAETKALRMGLGHLRGAYVTIKDGELWLLNATITGNASVRVPETDQTRSRKLLAKRKQIEKIQAEKQHGMTVVPLEIITSGRYVKLRAAIGRGKKKYDKRQVLKQRDEQRSINAAIKTGRQ